MNMIGSSTNISVEPHVAQHICCYVCPWSTIPCECCRCIKINYGKKCLSKPVAVAEWRTRLLTVREVSRSNPGNLPLLQTWHVGNVTGRHAVYTLIQCTPLLVEKAGVAPDVTFRITACKQERVQARYPLWIWNPWGRTHEVQNRSNQWLHKMDLGPDKNLKKKKKKSVSAIMGSSKSFVVKHIVVVRVKKKLLSV